MEKEDDWFDVVDLWYPREQNLDTYIGAMHISQNTLDYAKGVMWSGIGS